jgi:hypothetical protein
MIIRKVSGQYKLEMRAEEALEVINALSMALKVAQQNNFPQNTSYPASFTEKYDGKYYPNVIHFRVEPYPERD